MLLLETRLKNYRTCLKDPHGRKGECVTIRTELYYELADERAFWCVCKEPLHN